MRSWRAGAGGRSASSAAVSHLATDRARPSPFRTRPADCGTRTEVIGPLYRFYPGQLAVYTRGVRRGYDPHRQAVADGSQSEGQ